MAFTAPVAVPQEWHIEAEQLAHLRSAAGDPKPLFPSVDYLRRHSWPICSRALAITRRPQRGNLR